MPSSADGFALTRAGLFVQFFHKMTNPIHFLSIRTIGMRKSLVSCDCKGGYNSNAIFLGGGGLRNGTATGPSSENFVCLFGMCLLSSAEPSSEVT